MTRPIRQFAADNAEAQMNQITEQRVVRWFTACFNELVQLGMPAEEAEPKAMALFDSECRPVGYLAWPNAEGTARAHYPPVA